MAMFRKAVAVLACSVAFLANAEDKPQRVVSLGAAVTETVYALGHGDLLVGRDQTSLWPKAVHKVPDVGYPRQLALEGIISLLPDTVFASHDAGPPHVIDGLSHAGIDVSVIKTGPTWGEAKQGMRLIASGLNETAALHSMLDSADADLKAAAALAAGHSKTVLFILAEGPAGWMAAGNSTRAQTLVEALGAENVMGNTRAYRPLSAEAMLALAPDVILMASHGLKNKTLQETLASSGLDQLPAVKQGHIYVLDSSRYLTLGPRFGAAVKELAEKLYQPKG